MGFWTIAERKNAVSRSNSPEMYLFPPGGWPRDPALNRCYHVRFRGRALSEPMNLPSKKGAGSTTLHLNLAKTSYSSVAADGNFSWQGGKPRVHHNRGIISAPAGVGQGNHRAYSKWNLVEGVIAAALLRHLPGTPNSKVIPLSAMAVASAAGSYRGTSCTVQPNVRETIRMAE